VGWHCYRNYTYYNTGGSNITGGIIMYMVLYYNVGGGNNRRGEIIMLGGQ